MINKKIQQYIKSFIDKATALILLILLSPIFISISILIVICDGFPIYFIQKRPGKGNRIFKIIKFRTMKVQILNESQSDIARSTKLGTFLRSTSLDEMPQLINVLKGDLSFVGPRPLLTEYLPLYSEYQIKRHNVLPGITGWAQINGRNKISWEEKFYLDVWYVDNWSLLLDIKILIKTFFKVVSKKDINSSEDMTMEKFTGSKNEN